MNGERKSRYLPWIWVHSPDRGLCDPLAFWASFGLLPIGARPTRRKLDARAESLAWSLADIHLTRISNAAKPEGAK